MYKTKKTQYFITASIVLTSVACDQQSKQNQQAQQPNIILIMGDDMGFSDLGCYGAEIKTPNLDNLANNGLRFRTFYNSAKCNPTRSSLLTGLYNGDERAQSMSTLIGNNGYVTAMCGKEHFDQWIPKHCYAENSFDHSFTYWAISEYLIPPDSTFQHPFRLNGKVLEIDEVKVNNERFYKTDVVTDYAMQFIDSALTKDKPFFLYLPYHVAHYPLQALPEDIQKYRGKYRVGWDTIRKRRYEKMMELGIINEKYKLSEPTDNIHKTRGHPPGWEEIREDIPKYRPWNTLSDKEKEELDLEMAVFAAMIDRMDQNIGRLINMLKAKGIFDNTLIMYLSDNGSCPYDSNRDFDHPPGPADSYRTLCAAWANVGNTPFRYFKQFGHGGGCRTHFIVHWPQMIKESKIVTQPAHLIDIMPTLLEITGATYPDTVQGKPAIPLHGSSMLPIFKGEQRETPEFFISGFQETFRMFRKGDWKIVRANKEDWELYNVAEDPTETNNLASEMPEKLESMLALYKQKKKQYLEYGSANVASH